MSHTELTSISSNYPPRTFPMAANDLVGQSAEQVLAQLGAPDSNSEGMCWLPHATSREGTLPYVLVPGGGVIRAGVFGPIPHKIEFPTPYETWTYHNVSGWSWMLYLAAATQPQRHWWQPSTWWRGARQTAALKEITPRRQRPTPPLFVVEVATHPTGAAF